MTEKELLELAAKAAGIELCGEYKIDRLLTNEDGTRFSKPWNPLTNDGDALRLAVKLEMVIFAPDKDDQTAVARIWDGSGGATEEVTDRDHYAATRRAIVRAAAEIGRSMK